MAAETCGDGACSLHCLWGSLMSTPAGNTFYCEDARAKLLEAMPDNLDMILASSCGAAVRSLFDQLWSDTVSHVIRLRMNEAPMPGFFFVSSGGGWLFTRQFDSYAQKIVMCVVSQGENYYL